MTVGGQSIARDLRRIVQASDVLDGTAELRTYGHDASFLTQLAPRPPDAVVIARSVEDVQAVMRYAYEHAVPVTPRGAASAQTGAPVALTGGISLALNALDRILEIDVPNQQVFCEPGVVHAQLNEALAPHGLIFPPDPGSSRMATVGGMASTNAHGMRAVKYGPTASWVLGLDVVLSNGDPITTGSVGSRSKQSSSGLELTKLFVGSEGVLGVFTRLRLKLMPIPPARAIVLALFDVLDNAGAALEAVARAGISPSAIEILDQRTLRAVNLYRPGLRLPEVEAMLLFEVDGNPAGTRWDAEKIAEVVAPFARSAEWSDERKRIADLWEARSVVGAAVGRLRPGSHRAMTGEDICVPSDRVPEALRKLQEIGRQHQVTIATYGHIGGGGLHPALLINGRDAEEIHRALRVADEIHELALKLGGTVTGEHGVGAVRTQYMEREHGGALDTMRTIKRALDPKGIMNPSAIFPENVPEMVPEFPLRAPVGESPHALMDPG